MSLCSLLSALRQVCAYGVVDNQYLDLAFDQLEECFIADQTLFDEPALLQHKAIWNVVMYDKHGNEKENNFFLWCRKIFAIRDADGVAKEHTASETQERKWYKIEDVHDASRRRPDMQSRFVCFYNCDEQSSECIQTSSKIS